MGNNPSFFPRGDDYPVESISRMDVEVFLAMLNQNAAMGFRLPTEAEWEYGRRSGGKDQQFCGGNSPDEFAWFLGNSGKMPHPVAQKKPNDLGLYDMSGNVWEFCSDYFSRDFYATSPRMNPAGPGSGTNLIKRGGSWGIDGNFQRSAARGRSDDAATHYATGFRVAFSASKQSMPRP